MYLLLLFVLHLIKIKQFNSVNCCFCYCTHTYKCYGPVLVCVCLLWQLLRCGTPLGWVHHPPPPFPTFSLLAWTRGLHTHTALIRPPYCAPQIENSHTEGGRDKASGGRAKVFRCFLFNFPCRGTRSLTDRRLQLSIQLTNKHAA